MHAGTAAFRPARDGGVGEAAAFHGGHDRLARHGVETAPLDDAGCAATLRDVVRLHRDLWSEDVGQTPA